MTIKKLLVLFSMLLLISCAKQEDVHCLKKKLDLMESYQIKIELADDDPAQKRQLIRGRDAQLANF